MKKFEIKTFNEFLIVYAYLENNSGKTSFYKEIDFSTISQLKEKLEALKFVAIHIDTYSDFEKKEFVRKINVLMDWSLTQEQRSKLRVSLRVRMMRHRNKNTKNEGINITITREAHEALEKSGKQEDYKDLSLSEIIIKLSKKV